MPYYALRDAGHQVKLASPLGSAVPVDPRSVKAVGQNHPAVERFISDPQAQREINNTQRVSAYQMLNFDAVFFPGGHGTMWDLPTDASVQRVVEDAFATNKVIASVCHGAAGLVSAKRSDGLSILHGKRVNSFTDAEELAAELADVVPFALERRIRELGGHFVGAPNWQPFAVADGLLITGQNPQSSKLVAQLVIDALGAVSHPQAA